MPWLLDTNVLLRFVHTESPEYALVHDVIIRLIGRGEQLYYVPQSLVEFWNVCTRPSSARGGYGLSIEETDRRARQIEQFVLLLPDTPAIHTTWRSFVVDYAVSGVQVHDARIAAAMHVHRIPNLLTLNGRDFTRFPGITASHPSDVVGGMDDGNQP